MIDQDYVELLNRAPPSAEVVEWTFPTNILAGGFAAVLLGTPALSLVLYLAGSEGHNLESDDVELRVPSFTRLGMVGTSRETFTAGMHLAGLIAIPLFWCVRLAHRQRLHARTGIARYDMQSERALRWVSAAWFLGLMGGVCLFALGSVQGDLEQSWSARGVIHGAISLLAALGLIGQAICTYWAMRKARRVLVVSDSDRVSYRRKEGLCLLMVLSIAATVTTVTLLETYEDQEFGGQDGGRDCDTEWCYSRSALGLWEWVLTIEEAIFSIVLMHDLEPATGGVGVESFVL